MHRSAVSHPSDKGASIVARLEVPGQMQSVQGLFEFAASGLDREAQCLVGKSPYISRGLVRSGQTMLRSWTRTHPKRTNYGVRYMMPGGEGGIRTPDGLAPMPHFECGLHSTALPPLRGRAVASAGGALAWVLAAPQAGRGEKISRSGDRAAAREADAALAGRRVSAGRRSARDWANSTAPAWQRRAPGRSRCRPRRRAGRGRGGGFAVQVGGEASTGAGRNVGQHRLHHLGIAAVERAEHVEGNGQSSGADGAGLRRGHGTSGRATGEVGKDRELPSGSPPVLNRKVKRGRKNPEIQVLPRPDAPKPPSWCGPSTDPPSADPHRRAMERA